MPEMPDVAPGEVIESVWGNEVRDRSLQRYADETERDFLNGAPIEGELAWIENLNVTQVYNGTLWMDLLDGSGAGQIRNDSPLSFLTSVETVGAEIRYLPGDNWRFQRAGVARITIGAGETNFGSPVDGSTVMQIRDDAVVVTDKSIKWEDGGFDWVLNPSAANWRLQENTVYNGETIIHLAGSDVSGHSWMRLPNNPEGFFQFRPGDGSTFITRIMGLQRYAEDVHADSVTMRNVLAGTDAPNNAWGKDGDIYFRYDP